MTKPDDAAVSADPAPFARGAAETADLQAWLRRVADGDQAAFRRLFDATAPVLLAVAFRLTQDSQAAADAVHGVMMMVWRGPARFDPAHGTPLGWLLALVRQRAIEITRRRQRDGIFLDLSRRGDNPEADLARLAADPAASGFLAAFTSLAPDQQHLLSLAFLDGLSHAELAQRLRMPIGTARSQTREALSDLRTALESVA